MRLQKPFCRLPIRFDAGRLRDELDAAPANAWTQHPDDYPGNEALRLITAGGTENDDVVGVMQPTPHLAHFPYLQQVLESFGVVWSRSRLMKLRAHGTVPLHSDIKYHWSHRVRVHIPIVTNPAVRFTSGNETVHMAPGEAWIFDNWLPHTVVNGGDQDRVHLVADTLGNERFWHFATRGQWSGFETGPELPLLGYRPGAESTLLLERVNSHLVMPPAEVESIVERLCGDISLEGHGPEARGAILELVVMIKGFCSEWRQMWALAGDQAEGWPRFIALRRQLRAHLQTFKVPAYLRSNGALFKEAFQHGLMRQLLNAPDAVQDEGTVSAVGGARRVRIDRPIFIVSAPRSGSTLLFETLAQSAALCTVGGEAHELVEQFAALQPGAVESNRLVAANLTPDIAQTMRETLAHQLRFSNGQRPAEGQVVRVLEKTPKNSLRIPFLKAWLPDARFIFLWREPEDNLSSIIEAWRSGKFETYPALEGFQGPWSLLLPPGWRALAGMPLEDIAAFQWRVTNETILADLAELPRQDWTTIAYADLLAQPEREVRRLCEFMGVPFDDALRARVGAPLPQSQHTLTAPEREKWRRNAPEIGRVLPPLSGLAERLRSLRG